MQPSHKAYLLTVLTLIFTLLIASQIGFASGSHAAAQQATPTPGFGPAIGPDYVSPTPRATPIPSDLHPLPCQVTVLAAELPLYSEPNALAAQIGTVASQNRLQVSDLVTDVNGDQWVAGGGGWLPLTLNQTELAHLDEVRACALLAAGRPLRSTAFGLHMINATEGGQVINLVQLLQANGITLGTIKGINHTEQLLNSVKAMSPDTVVVFRSLYTTNSASDCPVLDRSDDFATLARNWITSLQPIWDGVDADYYEVMNECGSSVERQTLFSVEAMKVANELGYCVLLYGFSAGQPQIDEVDTLLPAIEYAAQNPCQPGRYHGISVHNYGEEGDTLLSEASEWLALRHRKLHETIVARVPSAVHIPFFITEAGPGGGGGFMNTPRCEDVYLDVVQYSYLLEQDPYVWGYHLWSFGAGTIWWDLTPCLDGIGAALIGYYGP